MLISILITAALAAGLMFFSYQVPEGGDPSDKIMLMFSIATMVLGLGAVTFFLKSLKDFKADLRLPYLLLSIGIVLAPLPEILLSAMIYFNLYASAAIQYIPYISISSYALMGIFMYAGTYRFARLLSAHNFWLQLKVMLPMAFAIVLICISLIYKFKPSSHQFDTLLGLTALIECAFFAFAAAMAAARIKSMLGTSYAKAMGWLTVAFLMTTFTIVHEFAVGLFLPEAWYAYLSYTPWTYLVNSLLFLYAGQLFWKAGRLGKKPDEGTTYIESISYIASLASKPKEIDELLDDLRLITSRMPAGATELSKNDKDTLTRLYYKLEDYLIHKDPLRKFTQEEVRSHLTYNFQKILSENPKR